LTLAATHRILSGMSKKFPDYVPPTQIAYQDDGGTTLHLRKCRLVVEREGGLDEQVFDQGAITIGAMDDNDVIIRDETVSRYHCKIIQEDNAYVLLDLGSTNGTFVNKVRIREAYLRPGCTITCGKTNVQFHSFDERVRIRPVELDRMGDIIGTNVKMREIFGILEKIAPTTTTVVIEGETGTGKEVVANTLHKRSNRRGKPFIVFDCSAVPENLIESELFGHEKGSFTGAIMARQGLFEMANGGTIFLDELGELSLELQPKLLRVLETREVRRVGGTRPMKVDVRVIAATNRRLEDEVRAGRFREDLFYRLSVVRIFLPPLRERREDIPLLVRHFLKDGSFNRDDAGNLRVRNIAREALDLLTNYDWPGNIRELLNAIERACSFAERDCIEVGDLPANVSARGGHVAVHGLDLGVPSVPAPAPVAVKTAASLPGEPVVDPGTFKEAKEQWVATFEREYVLTLLRRNGFNISHAAREADIDRKYFRKLMRKYGIDAGTDADLNDDDA
jgi:transcriptional regulator with GAF, ATPase, and Fis domain